MNYNINQICDIVNGTLHAGSGTDIDVFVKNVVFDSRKISFPKQSIFFALQGPNTDGHHYVKNAYNKHVRFFVVSKITKDVVLKDAHFILVKSPLKALQKLATFHRQQFDIPFIAITGSNGKTIIKEWLAQSLSQKYNVVKSPKSYNSQIGVALSLLEINESHEIAVIEAGISKVGEMSILEKMIKPNYGIFTNIGDAHAQGFDSIIQKIEEKIKLFTHCKKLIFCGDDDLVLKVINDQNKKIPCLKWGINSNCDIKIHTNSTTHQSTKIQVRFNNEKYNFSTGITQSAYVNNLSHIIAILVELKFSFNEISDAIKHIAHIPNRLELKQGKNQNLLLNDSYNTDLSSMQIALEYQDQLAQTMGKTLIFTDFDQRQDKQYIFNQLDLLFKSKNLDYIFAIDIDKNQRSDFKNPITFIDNLEELQTNTSYQNLKNQCILLKGSRKYKLESLFNDLSEEWHQTTLETNLSAIDHNLKVFRQYLKTETKIMAVIKADAYGSGSTQMANFLNQKQVDYLAVAIVDEGVKIRNSGCMMPIMIFNIQESDFNNLWIYNLEPEVYNLELLKKLLVYAHGMPSSLYIHIKIDSGMHRLGFMEDELSELVALLQNQNKIKVKSIFSHLAGSEDESLDEFTEKQIRLFEKCYSYLSKSLNISPLKHILNSSGIVRFNKYQYDMVRIGLGLYGIDETQEIKDRLEPAHTLKTKILQIKNIKKGQATGYGTKGRVDKNTTIAVVGIGYADGLMRKIGNGAFSMKVNNNSCPTVGNICMDVSMIDISNVKDVRIGDDVVVFSPSHNIHGLSESCETISYEIISRLSERIKRLYILE